MALAEMAVVSAASRSARRPRWRCWCAARGRYFAASAASECAARCCSRNHHPAASAADRFRCAARAADRASGSSILSADDFANAERRDVTATPRPSASSWLRNSSNWPAASPSDLVDLVLLATLIRPARQRPRAQRHLLLLGGLRVAGRRISSDRASPSRRRAIRSSDERGDELSPAAAQRHCVDRRVIQIVNRRSMGGTTSLSRCRRIVADVTRSPETAHRSVIWLDGAFHPLQALGFVLRLADRGGALDHVLGGSDSTPSANFTAEG